MCLFWLPWKYELTNNTLESGFLSHLGEVFEVTTFDVYTISIDISIIITLAGFLNSTHFLLTIKMRIEEIVLLYLISIIAICIWVLLYQVWMYLIYVKKKSISQPSQIHPEPETQQDIAPEIPDPSPNANQIPLQDLGQNQEQPNEDENQLQNVSPPLPNHDPEEPQASNSSVTITAYLYYRNEPDLPELVLY